MKTILKLLLLLLFISGCNDSNNPWPNHEIKQYDPDLLSLEVNRIEETKDGKSVIFFDVENKGENPINTFSINLTFNMEGKGQANRSWLTSLNKEILPKEKVCIRTIEDQLLTNYSFWFEVTGASMVTKGE